MTSRKSAFSLVLPLLLSAAITDAARAAGDVTEIHTTRVPAVPFSYTVDGFTYFWGMGNNELMTGFSTPTARFGYAMSANRVEVRRDDIADLVTGEPCGIFVERLADGDQSQSLAADYPSDGSGTGNCDIAAMLESRVINRGALDLFSNVLPDAKNIERLDYIFDFGLLAPLHDAAMARAGHVVSEKSSNNPVKVAAILALDEFGQPSDYGPQIFVDRSGCVDPALCYSPTPLTHQYTFLQNEFRSPQGFPTETERTVESVGLAYISTALLGLRAGQRYYGFSFFADDVDSNVHVLTDPATFPNDTSDDDIVVGDDADFYGGLSGYFVEDGLSVASGRVFKDENGDGVPTENEAGISDISIRIYADSDNNGVFDPAIDALIADPIDSDLEGQFFLPGLPDGTYFVFLDESDPDLPPGLSLPSGSNPQLLLVNGNDTSDVFFAFIDANDGGSTGGDTSGGVTGGSSDAGDSGTDGAGTGGSDSGTSDAGGSDSGSSDAGDSGTDGAGTGGSDSGASDAGGSDSGSSDAGDSGTDGAGTGGVDSGASDAGGSDSGSSDAGDSGSDGAGTGGDDSGFSDDGSNDSGSSDAGGSDTAGTGGDDSAVDSNGDLVTTANPDSFSVNSGESASVDVLANDIDGAGGGLVITSISESPNATITELNGVITYTPNFGFYGTDSFLYVAEDVDGTAVTGTVTANVIRFSDLNNNGENDFIECACTNLTLETGIRGSGVGSLSQFAIAFMSLCLIGRFLSGRRRRTGDRA